MRWSGYPQLELTNEVAEVELRRRLKTLQDLVA